jgi:Cu/Ag efflux pump CusA
VNEFGRLRHGEVDRAPIEVGRQARHEMARPVVFGVGIILLVYLPILSLRGMEGKMFRPMALTAIRPPLRHQCPGRGDSDSTSMGGAETV